MRLLGCAILVALLALPPTPPLPSPPHICLLSKRPISIANPNFHSTHSTLYTFDPLKCPEFRSKNVERAAKFIFDFGPPIYSEHWHDSDLHVEQFNCTSLYFSTGRAVQAQQSNQCLHVFKPSSIIIINHMGIWFIGKK